jgi:hypothetical protein
MSRTTPATTRIFTILLAAVTATALAGCGASSPELVDDPAVTTPVETPAAETPSGDKFDTVALPDDFPASVPLHSTVITSASSVKMGGDRGYWELHVRTSDAGKAIAEVRAELVAAGFAEKTWNEVGALVSGAFTSAELRVAVQTAGDRHGDMIIYTVNEL